MAALNKYWRPLTDDEYLHQMDLTATQTAITVAQFPEAVQKWIWQEPTKNGIVWTS